jgi:hypothetical protein
MTATLDRIMGAHSVEIPPHLEAQAEVPLISGKPQRQGDVLVMPMRSGKVDGLAPIPDIGIAVVQGQGGNTHLLVSEGPVSWAPNKQQGAIQGSLVVEEGGSAYLLHAEHGCTAIGPGNYVIRRQREQADAIRLVAD